MKIFRLFSFALVLLFVMSNVAFATSNANSWYCKRTKNHIQPELPEEMRYAEKYSLYWCDKKHTGIDDGDKVIYLTFDAGYENGNIEKIMDVLKEEDVKGTFFILDNVIMKNEELVRRMIDEGHIVANHTFKHKDMTKMTTKDEFLKELVSLENLFEKTFSTKMEKYYRPPEGKISEQNLKWAEELGYKTVMWSFAYADWDNGKQPSLEYAKNLIIDNIHNGEVMLLHPTSSTNAQIMRDIIKELKSQGFRFGTVDELCQD